MMPVCAASYTPLRLRCLHPTGFSCRRESRHLVVSSFACWKSPASHNWRVTRFHAPRQDYRTQVVTRASERSEGSGAFWPWEIGDYYRAYVKLVHVFPLEGGEDMGTGKVILVRHDAATGQHSEDDALVMYVMGDTLHALVGLLQKQELARPLSLQLLWSVLERGKQISRRNWDLLHVAIVGLEISRDGGGVYIGRLFFGDSETNEILWDCDCRPSDSFWLALKSKRPIYVKKDVWQQCAQPMGQLKDLLALGAPTNAKTAAKQPLSSGPEFVAIKHGDPLVIQRLKREMQVAIAEEDYKLAAKIRDHPYIQLYLQIERHKIEGDHAGAVKLQSDLENLLVQDGHESI